MLPSSSLFTTTTSKPAITALAGLVPCAEAGMRQTSAVAVAAALVPLPDDQQARVLALAAGVGLERHGGEAGDLREHPLQLPEELLVALGLPERSEGVHPGEAGARSPGSSPRWR